MFLLKNTTLSGVFVAEADACIALMDLIRIVKSKDQKIRQHATTSRIKKCVT